MLIVNPPPAAEDELRYFRELIRDLAGITLAPTKNVLIESRLRARLTAVGVNDYSEYHKLLLSLPREHTEWQAFINLLTTNKTDFFREIHHFEFLVETILPRWLKKNEKHFRVWTCAASTGEEPYTLAMVLASHMPKDRTFEILATDIDTAVLSTAQNAVYPQSKLHELPGDYGKKDVELGKGSAEGWFRIRRDLRSHVTFKQHNLIDPSLPDSEPFDLILCRNVMIYFARDTIEQLANKLGDAGRSDSYLFIGHSETLQGMKHPWSLVEPAILVKARSPKRR